MKKRRRSPSWYLLRRFWHEGVEQRLDKFERKLDKLIAQSKTHLKDQIGFHHPE